MCIVKSVLAHLLCACPRLQVSSIAHAVCFGFTHLSSFLHVAVHALLQFLGSGCIVATTYWFLANKYLTVVSPHRYRTPAPASANHLQYAPSCEVACRRVPVE